MKNIVLALTIFTSSLSFAGIGDSQYEARHITVIEKAIARECGRMKELTQVSSKSVTRKIDQGITDIDYTTVLTGLRTIDQSQPADSYKIIVKSTLSDSYDHESRNWGSYYVSSVTCVME